MKNKRGAILTIFRLLLSLEEVSNRSFGTSEKHIFTKRFVPIALLWPERGGVVAEQRTSNREVLGSIPTGGTMLCP